MRLLAALAVATASLLGCSSSSGGLSAGSPSDGGAADGPLTAGDGSVTDGGTLDSSQGEVSTGDDSSSGSGDSGSTTTAEAGSEGGAGEAGVMQTVEMTFYGWDDNSPPGNAIAYPAGSFPTVHTAAGGTGTYADPITYATDKSEIPIGTRLYAPVI